jgi:hypothetical protein
MSSRRRAASDISPAPAAVARLANAADNAPAPVGARPAAAVQPRTRAARRAIRSAVVAGCVSIAGGSAGWMFGGPVLAIVGVLALIAAGVMGTAAAVALSALLGRRDPRSPFDRLMLILCVVLGRSPGTYLPPAALPGIPAASELPNGSCPARASAPGPRGRAE